jgi:hypothetical protein
MKKEKEKTLETRMSLSRYFKDKMRKEGRKLLMLHIISSAIIISPIDSSQLA